MRERLINCVAMQVGWFACVLGAAHGSAWTGPVLVAVVAAVHLASRRERLIEAFWLAGVGVVGSAIDSVHVLTGAVTFSADTPAIGLAPIWIAALWINFATTFTVCLAWMQRRTALAAAFGAVGGPLAYWSAQRLGAVEFPSGPAMGCAILAVTWGIATPLLLRLSAAIDSGGRSKPEGLAKGPASDKPDQEVQHGGPVAQAREQ